MQTESRVLIMRLVHFEKKISLQNAYYLISLGHLFSKTRSLYQHFGSWHCMPIFKETTAKWRTYTVQRNMVWPGLVTSLAWQDHLGLPVSRPGLLTSIAWQDHVCLVSRPGLVTSLAWQDHLGLPGVQTWSGHKPCMLGPCPPGVQTWSDHKPSMAGPPRSARCPDLVCSQLAWQDHVRLVSRPGLVTSLAWQDHLGLPGVQTWSAHKPCMAGPPRSSCVQKWSAHKPCMAGPPRSSCVQTWSAHKPSMAGRCLSGVQTWQWSPSFKISRYYILDPTYCSFLFKEQIVISLILPPIPTFCLSNF